MRMKWAVVLLPVAVAFGCADEDKDESSRPATLGTATIGLRYNTTGDPVTIETTDPDVLARESELETLTNNHRVAVGLNALVSRQDIRSVSRAHAEHMISHAFFDHVNPEGDWPWDRASRAGILWNSYGENLAGNYATATDALNAFLASPGHRANIEDPDWTGHGYGYAYNGGAKYRHYWTQNFIRP
ncbi:MAG: CAP domain-containing protein [Planctomycetes bacterium]|nr:CAP domain-containing protein [Planctomycetota bacterium]